MKPNPLALIPLLCLVGCVTLNKHYSIEVRRPVQEICFVDIQWQTDWSKSRSPNWEESVTQMARQATESELKRLGFPCGTIYVGKPTMLEGGSWVAIFAIAGNLAKGELQAEAKKILDAVPPGKQLPAPVYRGKGEFQ